MTFYSALLVVVLMRRFALLLCRARVVISDRFIISENETFAEVGDGRFSIVSCLSFAFISLTPSAGPDANMPEPSSHAETGDRPEAAGVPCPTEAVDVPAAAACSGAVNSTLPDPGWAGLDDVEEVSDFDIDEEEEDELSPILEKMTVESEARMEAMRRDRERSIEEHNLRMELLRQEIEFKRQISGMEMRRFGAEQSLQLRRLKCLWERYSRL